MADIIVSMQAEAAGLVSGAKSGQQALDGLAERAKGMKSALVSAFTTPIGAAIGLTAAIAGLAAIGVKYANELDEISDRTGVAAASIIALQRASISAGIGSEALTLALTTMNNVVGQALTGNEGAERSLAKLGLRLTDIADKSPIERFLIIGTAIGSIGDNAQRAALGQEIFGKSSSKLSELLPDLRTRFEEAQKAMLLSNETSDAAVISVDRLGASLSTLTQSAKEAGLSIAGGLATAVNALIAPLQSLRDASDAVDDALGIGINTGPATEAEIGLAHLRRDLAKNRQADAAKTAAVIVQTTEEERKAKQAAIDAEITARKAAGAQRAADLAAYRAHIGGLIAENQAYATSQVDATTKERTRFTSQVAEIKGAAAKIGAIDAEGKQALITAQAQHEQRLSAIRAEGIQKTVADYRGALAEYGAWADDLNKQFADHQKKAFADAGQNFNFVTGKTPAQQADIDKRKGAAEGVIGDVNKEAADAAAAADPIAAEQALHEQRMAVLNDAKSAEISLEAQANAALEAEKLRHNNKVDDLERKKFDTQVSIATMTLGNLAVLMQSGNKKLFAIGKAAAIAQATVSTFAGAANAFRDVPYPFNFAASASVLAAGMVQIQNISSVQASGGGGGGGGGGSPAYGAGDNVGPGAKGPGGSPTNVSLALEDDSFFSGRSVRKLIDKLNSEHADGYVLRVG